MADRLIEITLDEETLAAQSADAEHERRVAIFDLIEANQFSLAGEAAGPYRLHLSVIDQRLALEFRNEAGDMLRAIQLSLTPLKRIIKDYTDICTAYHDAIRTATPMQIETVDMARRALHNEGGDAVIARLEGKAQFDAPTARRLFTLICALKVRC